MLQRSHTLATPRDRTKPQSKQPSACCTLQHASGRVALLCAVLTQFEGCCATSNGLLSLGSFFLLCGGSRCRVGGWRRRWWWPSR